jgi:copper(I)-binding protein
MTRGGSLVAMVALAVFFLVQTEAAERGSLTVYPLATPAIDCEVEMLDAVPVALVIHNSGNVEDRLLGGDTTVAERVDLHHTRLNHGRREMLNSPDGLAIPGGATAVFESGSDHVMLVGLQTDLVQGESFPLTLHFAQAGDVTVAARVRRKVDAAGIIPIPPVVAGDLSVSLASAPPAGTHAVDSPH